MHSETSATTHDRDNNDINLTPMLDVVFIMLIFFIVTASFARELGIDVNRLASSNPTPTIAPAVLIAIDGDDRIWIGQRHIDPRALRANLERLRAGQPAGAVVVHTASASHTETLVAVLDAARAAGIFDVAMADPSPATP